jgi:hypothetical protein
VECDTSADITAVAFVTELTLHLGQPMDEDSLHIC